MRKCDAGVFRREIAYTPTSVIWQYWSKGSFLLVASFLLRRGHMLGIPGITMSLPTPTTSNACGRSFASRAM